MEEEQIIRRSVQGRRFSRLGTFSVFCPCGDADACEIAGWFVVGRISDLLDSVLLYSGGFDIFPLSAADSASYRRGDGVHAGYDMKCIVSLVEASLL